MGRNLSGKISYGQFWQFFPSLLTIVAEFFPYFFLDIKFKICTLCSGGGGGMIGGGGGAELDTSRGWMVRVLSFRALQAAYHM